ncbi:hypothetical protein ACLIBH_05375 [Virgibacillus sp. W0430]|uniref:hypothetical protein n=1 Tax=Virgibacillus sp. W0430 TaxID=3391580 RepID=UPI003F48192D
MGNKKVVFAFGYEAMDELVDRFSPLERQLGERFEYYPIMDLDGVEEVLRNNDYKDVYVSSVEVFDDLEDFWWFSEVVLGNGAHYHIDEEGINSEEMYPIGEILVKIGTCFNGY